MLIIRHPRLCQACPSQIVEFSNAYTSLIRNKRIKKQRAIKNLKDVPIHQVHECRSKNEQGNEQRGPSPVITLTWSDTRQASPKETERRAEGVLSGKVANEVRG